jgi:enolase-phosphatase E1
MSSNQPLAAAHAQTVLLDVEGTTTPVEFVHEVLFPFAHRHVREFIRRQRPSEEVLACLSELKEERHADVENGLTPPEWQEGSDELLAESVAAYVYWLMDEDRKSTALKSLQGKIWEAGYLDGSLRAPVYSDVPHAFKRWRGQGRGIYIYSSGSILAQKLLFAHTNSGDLTGFIDGYFDTTTGAKTSADSYRSIGARMHIPAAEVLFLSDVAAELDAAREAGMKTALCARAGWIKSETPGHQIILTFDVVFP